LHLALSCRLQCSPAICKKVELTISHQTNLNSLCENNHEFWQCRARCGTYKQTAFNLPRNNLHFPVQRFHWEIYCEYACSTYEYEYEKIIMPTMVRGAASLHIEKLFFSISLSLSSCRFSFFSSSLSFLSLKFDHFQSP